MARIWLPSDLQAWRRKRSGSSLSSIQRFLNSSIVSDALCLPFSEIYLLKLGRRAVSRLRAAGEETWEPTVIQTDFSPIFFILDAPHPCFQGYQELSVPKALEDSEAGGLWVPLLPTIIHLKKKSLTTPSIAFQPHELGCCHKGCSPFLRCLCL